MDTLTQLGKFLLTAGLLTALVGFALMSVNRLSYLGKISGDLIVKSDSLMFYSPVTLAVVLSVVLTLLLNFIIKH